MKKLRSGDLENFIIIIQCPIKAHLMGLNVYQALLVMQITIPILSTL